MESAAAAALALEAAVAFEFDEEPAALEEEAVAFTAALERAVRAGRLERVIWTMLTLSTGSSSSSSFSSDETPSMSIDSEREVLAETAATAVTRPRVSRAVLAVGAEDEEEAATVTVVVLFEPVVSAVSTSWSLVGGGEGDVWTGAGAGLARRMPRSFKKLVRALVGPRTLLTKVFPLALFLRDMMMIASTKGMDANG